MKVKYIRWSTIGQTGARQLLDSDKYDLVIQEQISGSIAFAKRPKGAELLRMIRDGRVRELYVEEFSRLGRSAFDCLTTLQICEEHRVVVHIQNMRLSSWIDDKPNPLFKMFSHIISVVGEQERELIRERTAMGRIAARARGVTFGRPAGSNERKADFMQKEINKKILKYLNTGDYSIRQIAKLTDSSTATVQKVKRIAKEIKALVSTNYH